MIRYGSVDMDALRALLPPGTTVCTVLLSVSSSGMSRRIMPLVVDGKGDIRNLSAYAIALGAGRQPRNGADGVTLGGYGMDMGFSLVYSLGRGLYPDGFACIGERCPSNDHMNGDRDYTPGHTVHGDGGYALRHRWL